MALIRHEPWSLMTRLHDELNRTFSDWAGDDTSSATASWVPRADVEEYADRFEIFVDLPGVDAKAVEITLERGVLTLAGERNTVKATEEVLNGRRERATGRFHRRFILPESVDSENVKARSRDGVLEVTIPKQPKAQPRRIEVLN